MADQTVDSPSQIWPKGDESLSVSLASDLQDRAAFVPAKVINTKTTKFTYAQACVRERTDDELVSLGGSGTLQLGDLLSGQDIEDFPRKPRQLWLGPGGDITLPLSPS